MCKEWIWHFSLLCLVVGGVTACRQQKTVLPASTQQPYEILVVGDIDSLLYHCLSVPMVGLPQVEPTFDVTCVKTGDFDAQQRLMRQIIVVRQHQGERNKSAISHERNCYAQPQVVMYIDVNSKEELQRICENMGKEIRQVFIAQEYEQYILHLRQNHEVKTAQRVQRMFGYRLMLPADMQSYKVGKNFLWLSNNAVQGLQNICVYAIQGLNQPTLQQTDSVLQANIKGETDENFMQTVRASMQDETFFFHQKRQNWQRGQWEMCGDMMGGPLVRKVVIDSTARQTVVFDAFVYAPEGKKRNRMRALEAALLTIQKTNKNRKEEQQ